jgi:hypothetical protein
MIADLKADSERWDAERRATASGGRPSNGTSLRDANGNVRKSNTPVVEYRASTTHQSRQYYGPTEATQAVQQAYPPASSAGVQQGVYDSNQYQQQQSYAQPAAGVYSQPQQGGYPIQDNYSYIAGGDLRADMSVDPRSGRVPVTQAGTIPRANQYAASTPTYAQADTRSTYNPYSPQPPVSAAQYAPQQPTDPYYGRGAYNHQPFS